MEIQSATKELLRIASEYRKTDDIPDGGYVAVHNLKVVGWSRDVKGKSHELLPGTWAVDALGHKFLAIGGNDYDGVKEWQMISHTS
ncbi:antirestriction protein ArdR [Aliikangiella coralliicola]|uniref:Antirestriction protein ArdR n=1 Tax=Aliikangiella coralliicola TaxID=2592383 RepID=A0A545U8Z6_9GAMM|nr:antirestriction protein ArdR [Aliikangiella coralliicola]TQV85935.1 antirestriction protein ArdR [Aliikangiella coralliicola]